MGQFFGVFKQSGPSSAGAGVEGRPGPSHNLFSLLPHPPPPPKCTMQAPGTTTLRRTACLWPMGCDAHVAPPVWSCSSKACARHGPGPLQLSKSHRQHATGRCRRSWRLGHGSALCSPHNTTLAWTPLVHTPAKVVTMRKSDTYRRMNDFGPLFVRTLWVPDPCHPTTIPSKASLSPLPSPISGPHPDSQAEAEWHMGTRTQAQAQAHGKVDGGTWRHIGTQAQPREHNTVAQRHRGTQWCGRAAHLHLFDREMRVVVPARG